MKCYVTAFGDVFSSIGVREPQPAASEAFSQFGEAHRDMERFAIKMLKTVKPVSTYLLYYIQYHLSGTVMKQVADITLFHLVPFFFVVSQVN